MWFEKIDKRFMELFNEFRKAMFQYDAFRHMWAEKVVISRGVDLKNLEKGQSDAIRDMLSTAENVRKHLGLQWVTVLPDSAGDLPDGLYLGKCGSGPIVALEIRAGLCYSNGTQMPGPAALINLGWKLDGPIRSAILD